ncbi:hypothetical protein N7G274_002183 [Stereocaulon virgatum]|uniref:Uncharacterized protein n=1 Tax=Stereocaulon virgatum TaxID=373712 RepID=A0ABR4AM31_9LECA
MTNPDNVTFLKGEPFTLNLGPKKKIILTSNGDVAAAWKDTAALTFDPLIKQLMTDLGMSETTQDTLHREEPERFMLGEKVFESLSLVENPLHQAFDHRQMVWIKRQLPGNMLADLGKQYVGHIN